VQAQPCFSRPPAIVGGVSTPPCARELKKRPASPRRKLFYTGLALGVGPPARPSPVKANGVPIRIRAPLAVIDRVCCLQKVGAGVFGGERCDVAAFPAAAPLGRPISRNSSRPSACPSSKVYGPHRRRRGSRSILSSVPKPGKHRQACYPEWEVAPLQKTGGIASEEPLPAFPLLQGSRSHGRRWLTEGLACATGGYRNPWTMTAISLSPDRKKKRR